MTKKIPVGDGTYCYSGPTCRKHGVAHATNLKKELFTQLPITGGAEKLSSSELKKFIQKIQQTDAVEAVLPVTVLTATGRTASITPGVYNEEALDVYGEGQCVALAVAFAEHMGESEIQLAVHVEEQRIIHAWAEVQADPYAMYDFGGRGDVDSYRAELDQDYGEDDWEWRVLTVAEAKDIKNHKLSSGLPDQNFELAATMPVEAVKAGVARAKKYGWPQEPDLNFPEEL